MLLGTVLLQFIGDQNQWRLPWYFLHECLLIGLPMLWLLLEVFSKSTHADRLGFIASSSLFLTLGSIFELVAIQNRYWWFFEDLDRLIGMRIGAIPIEEFLYYPFILNIPILAYILLNRAFPEAAGRSSSAPRTSLNILAVLLGVAGVGLAIAAYFNTTPTLDLSILPSVDEAGALRYGAGPKKWGWSTLQLVSAGLALGIFNRWRARINQRALLLLLAGYFPYCFFLELMACGRGWWVWNGQQVLGFPTWVIPLDSYLMYVTGAVLPVFAFVWLRQLLSNDEATPR